MLEAAVEVIFEGWALAVEAVTERIGRFAGFAVALSPIAIIALAVWLIVISVG